MVELSISGTGILSVILSFTIYHVHGVNFGNMYEIYRKYGFWTWDMNAFLIMIPIAQWTPVAFFFSYKGQGKQLAKFTQEYQLIGKKFSGMT